MDYRKELDKIDTTIKERTLEKAKVETKLDNLKNERSKIISELAELGIKEDEIDNLQTILANLETSIEDEINKVKKILEV